MATFGLHGVFATPIDGKRSARIAELLVDARWPWPRPLLRVRPVPGRDAPFVKKRLGKDALDEVCGVLESETALRVGLVASTTESDDNAWIWLDTGREPYPDGKFPYDVRAMCRAATADWVECMHELVLLLGVAHGSIIAADDEAVVRSEVWAQHESHEGREAHPNPPLISALATKRHGLGDRWVRPARWGTYLNAEQLRALGGREAIERVKPPVVRELGALLYVQLSTSPADALAPETLAKQDALEAVLAAMLVPC